VLARIHTQRPDLDDEVIDIAIHDQPGQVVALTVDQAVGIGFGIQIPALAAFYGFPQPHAPEV